MLEHVIRKLSSFRLFSVQELQDIKKKLSANGNEAIWAHLCTFSGPALHDAGMRILSATPGEDSQRKIEDYSPIA